MSPLRVLLIEDSESDAALIRRLLKKADPETVLLRVEEAGAMRAALNNGSWDVILADYCLPHFDAFLALRILRETGMDIPFIVVSGTVGEEVAVKMMKCGAHDYLLKDDLMRLIPAIEREVKEARRRSEHRQSRKALSESEERLTLALEATQLGTFDFNPQSGDLVASQFARRHFGLPGNTPVTCDMLLAALHPDDREVVQRVIQKVLQRKADGQCAADFRTVGTDDGVERWLSVTGRVLFDADGNPIRFVGVSLDITGRKQIEEALRWSVLQEEQTQGELRRQRDALRAAYSELAAIYANAPVMLLVVDEALNVEKVNDQAARFAGQEISEMLGLRQGEAMGCLNALDNPEGCGFSPLCQDCAFRGAVLDTVKQGNRYTNVETWLPVAAASHQQRCLLISTTPMQFNGRKKALVCAQDITRLKHTVRQLETALTEKTVLLKEVHHRVKNNLAVISSLLSMQTEVGGPEARLALGESHRRVHSIALIHEFLYGNDRLDRVNFAEYAQRLVPELHAACAGDPLRIALHIEAEPIELGIDRAVPCALILNELLTNAFKHAFPGGRDGEIRVSFRQSEPGMLELSITDNGVGAKSEPSQAAHGIGLSIVRILTAQLDGSLERQPCAGTCYVLRFPAVPSPRAVLTEPIPA
ncbi:MAG: hypothetical protein C5B51_04715 [Terriglobia bacterium]|nr:MAG: hypothetical protein C5B51_04715 [Terriglobia bacterium]